MIVEEESCSDEEQDHIAEVISYLAIGHSRNHKIMAMAQAPPLTATPGAGVDCGGPATVTGPTGSQAGWGWAPPPPDSRTDAEVCQDTITATLDDVNTICCADQTCEGDSFPASCNEDCAGLWEPMWESCGGRLTTMFATQPSMASSLTTFSAACDATLYGSSCPADYYQLGLQQLATKCPGAPADVPCDRVCAKFFDRFYGTCQARMADYTTFAATCDQTATAPGGGH